jgi:hypothetical protein
MITTSCRLSPLAKLAACAAVLAASSGLDANPAAAADTLVYSFETDLEGFAANGGGVTVTQDTIGVTNGASSMKVTAVSGQTFYGANTGMLHPAIGDPPGLDHVTFDLTITEEYAGSFAVIGVMIFGVNQTGDARQLQTGPSDDPALEFHIEGLAVGTYPDVTIDMTRFFNPDTFEPGTFNDIVGTEGSGPFDLIPTGFQLYLNKLGAPLTVYIDNIRVGTTPVGLAGDYNNDGMVDAVDYTVWRNNLGDTDETNINNNGDGQNGVDPADYTLWKDHYGDGAPGGGGIAGGIIPEPASGVLLLVAAISSSGTRRGPRARLNPGC